MGVHITPTHIASGLFYFANYYNIYIGYPLYSPMPVLWSLSVEEHYYIVFPFLLLVFRKNREKALPLLSCLLALALFWRMAVYRLCAEHPIPFCGMSSKLRLEGTDMIFDCILYGAVAFLVAHYHHDRIRSFLINRSAMMTALCTLLACVMWRDPFFRATLRYSLEAASSAILVLNMALGEDGWAKKRLCAPGVLFIGRISYALYLMHFGALISLEATKGATQLDGPADMARYFVLSFFLAGGCYFLIEKPVMKIRRRFSRTRMVS